MDLKCPIWFGTVITFTENTVLETVCMINLFFEIANN